MTISLNRVELIGTLGQTPVLKLTAGEKKFARLSVATQDGTGDYRKTNWHQVTLWGKNAENAVRHLTKGATVYVEGTLSYPEYEKDGVKRKNAEIVGFRVIYLMRGPEDLGKKKVEEEPLW